jgi:Glycosyl transferases group 1
MNLDHQQGHVIILRIPGLEPVHYHEDVVTQFTGIHWHRQHRLLPTSQDACSLVVFEAMACGLPCITTRTNGASGIIPNGKDGITVGNPPQPLELADKMAQLLDPHHRESTGRGASVKASQYCMEKNHQGVLRILNALAGAPQGGSQESERRGCQGCAGPTLDRSTGCGMRWYPAVGDSAM